MDRMTKAVVGGKARYFNFSVAVMFDVVDRYGTTPKMIEAMQGESRAVFEEIAWAAMRMQEDAELIRRDMGYEPVPMLKKKDFSTRMSPAEFVAIREAVTGAIVNGYKREHDDEEEEVDVFLEEIEAKKGKAGA